MTDRLPPLTALRSFEAAARHLSFTRAAEELFVTQAAVSHQIKGLEQALGVALFHRMNRHLSLTDDGQLLLPFVREAFDKLQAGVRQLERASSAGRLVVSTTASFATHWLVRRLGRFQVRHPEIELQINATARAVDLHREPIDAAIRYGRGNWPGLKQERLFNAERIPVCSPALLKGDRPLRKPADLVHHTLLHALESIDEWTVWLRAAGVTNIDPMRGPKFDNGSIAIQAAAAGAGVALGLQRVLVDDLAAGRLIVPFTIDEHRDLAYYFVVPESMATLPKIVAFKTWLVQEVTRTAGDSQENAVTKDDMPPHAPAD